MHQRIQQLHLKILQMKRVLLKNLDSVEHQVIPLAYSNFQKLTQVIQDLRLRE